MKLRCSLLAALLALPGITLANGPCYTVYDANNALIYQADQPPIDLSRPISVGMAKRFPGGHLVMSSNTSDCPPLSAAATPPAGGRLVSESPALQLAREYGQPPKRR